MSRHPKSNYPLFIYRAFRTGWLHSGVNGEVFKDRCGCDTAVE